MSASGTINMHKKEFAVVRFLSDNSIEAIPAAWLVDDATTKWPNVSDNTAIRFIKDCRAVEPDWTTLQVKIYCYSGSFKKAQQKANKYLETSAISSDATDMDMPPTRKRKMTRKYEQFVLSEESDQEESLSLLSGQHKKYPPPIIPEDETVNDITDTLDESYVGYRNEDPNLSAIYSSQRTIQDGYKHISKIARCSNQKMISKNSKDESQTLRCDLNQKVVPMNCKNRDDNQTFRCDSNQKFVSKNSKNRDHSQALRLTHSAQRTCEDSKNDASQNALFVRMFEYMEELKSEIRDLHKKMDSLMLEKYKQNDVSLHVVPPEMQLPVSSVEHLVAFEKKLKEDQDFFGLMVRYLHDVGCGKTESAFLLSITKKVLAQQVAMLYSRYGRKGKKPFTEFNATLSVILAATCMKFKNSGKELLMDHFGRALAGASDWGGRKVRPSDPSCSLHLDTDSLSVHKD